MAILKPKTKTPPAATAAEAFIAGAPDAGQDAAKPARETAGKGKKQQISLTVDPELLAQIDQLAASMGQSRAGLINQAIYRLIRSEQA